MHHHSFVLTCVRALTHQLRGSSITSPRNILTPLLLERRPISCMSNGSAGEARRQCSAAVYEHGVRRRPAQGTGGPLLDFGVEAPMLEDSSMGLANLRGISMRQVAEGTDTTRISRQLSGPSPHGRVSPQKPLCDGCFHAAVRIVDTEVKPHVSLKP